MDVKALALGEKDYIIAQRHYLHAHPELSTKEFATTEHIIEELKKMGIEVITFPNTTGCVGVIKGEKPGKTVMLRADIDALPIQEEDLSKSYASKVPGVMHACGHDCHTAMLLGAGRILSRNRQMLRGTVKLLFQMGEEIGTESRHYVEAGALEGVDAIFGQHIWALLPAGRANFADGERMACSDRFTITIQGKAAHGSAPHEGSDGIIAAAAIVMGLQTLVSRRNNPQNSFVLTVGMMNGGTQSNIIAEKVELVGTTRTFNKVFRKELPAMIEKVAKEIAKGYGCTADSTYFFGPAPLINEHEELNETARSAVLKIMGEDALIPFDKHLQVESLNSQ